MATGGTGKMTGTAGATENGAMKGNTEGSMTGAETGTGRPLTCLCKLLQPIHSERWPAQDRHREDPHAEPACDSCNSDLQA